MIKVIDSSITIRIICDYCRYSATLTMDEGTYEDPIAYWKERKWIIENAHTFCCDRCKNEYERNKNEPNQDN